MIEKVRIQGYRKFANLDFKPNRRFNIIVGENESGKSTLIEAIGLALTGRVNGRNVVEELNPYFFNRALVAKFFEDRRQGKMVQLPSISIEIFLEDRVEFKRRLYGAHNSDMPTRACAGVSLRVLPNVDYCDEIEAHVLSSTDLLPIEYYSVEWRTFGDQVLTSRPKELATAMIDSRTIRTTSGVDYHLRQMLNDHLEPEERAAVSLAFRSIKEQMTEDHLQDINAKMAKIEGSINDQPLSLAMDQSARSGWDSSVVPHVADVPFGMAGQGQQAAVKIALAMGRSASSVGVVMVEEPENHLSHTSLNRLLKRIQHLSGEQQQVFVTTHSSFVLNRLGVDGLILLSNGQVSTLLELPNETVDYFRKLPGYDTLRIVLADRVVLVEGPSDEIVFERFYMDEHDGRRPIEDGIDVISMRGLSLRRCLELAATINKRCAALRDNDGVPADELRTGLDDLLDGDMRRLFIGDNQTGRTLEPQILAANPDDEKMRRILGVTDRAALETWMRNNKTEAALRIAETSEQLTPPVYICEAIEFISHGRP